MLPGVAHTKAFDADRATYVAKVDEFVRSAVAGYGARRPGTTTGGSRVLVVVVGGTVVVVALVVVVVAGGRVVVVSAGKSV